MSRWVVRAALPLALLTVVAACDGSPSSRGALRLQFRHHLGGQPLQTGTFGTTSYGATVAVERLHYWVDDVALRRRGQWTLVAGGPFLIEVEPVGQRTELLLAEVPTGDYDAVAFHLGVSSVHAAAHPPPGELGLHPSLLRKDLAGWVFVGARGTWTQAGESVPFEFAVGTPAQYKRLTAEYAVSVREGQASQLTFDAELDRLFVGLPPPTATGLWLLGGTPGTPAGHLATQASWMFTLADPVAAVAVVPFDVAASDATPTAVPLDPSPPKLTAPVVAPADLACGAAADPECVWPFAASTSGGASGVPGWLSWQTKVRAPVRSAAAGVVDAVTWLSHDMMTHTDDYRISIRCGTQSAFWLDYGNVTLPKVKPGDVVAAGDLLALASDDVVPLQGRVLFSVRRQQTWAQRLCPLAYAEPAFAAWLTELAQQAGGSSPSALCGVASAVCQSASCSVAGGFKPAEGDIERGRDIYVQDCASCHGDQGQAGSGPALCANGTCGCNSCASFADLAQRIQTTMPPEGTCDAECAAAVAAWLRFDQAPP
jgi:hypothetical protein